jgi:hypothetical protein
VRSQKVLRGSKSAVPYDECGKKLSPKISMLAMKHLGGASSTNSAQILYARQPTYRERLRLGTNRTSRTNHQLESTRVRAAAGNSMLRYGVRALLGASAACASAAASGIFLISACALVPPLGAILFISYISSEVFFAADTARKQWLKLNSLQRSPLVSLGSPHIPTTSCYMRVTAMSRQQHSAHPFPTCWSCFNHR